VAPPQPAESECWREDRGGSFRGSLSTIDVGGSTVIYEQIGALDVERRGAQLKDRRDRELERLQKTVAALC